MCLCPRVLRSGPGGCCFCSQKRCARILVFPFFLVSENVSWQMGVERKYLFTKSLFLKFTVLQLVGTWLAQRVQDAFRWQSDVWGHGLSSERRTH